MARSAVKRIGIFGGSFSPVHEGHLKLAEHAVDELNLDALYFVPSNVTPLKNKAVLMPAKERVRKLRRILKRSPKFKLSLYEVGRPGPSYSVDTIKHFREKFGSKNSFYFISGADTLKNLSRWKNMNEILDLCHFVVGSRPGYRVKNVPARVLYMPFEALDISSTGIRRSGVKKSKTKK